LFKAEGARAFAEYFIEFHNPATGLPYARGALCVS